MPWSNINIFRHSQGSPATDWDKNWPHFETQISSYIVINQKRLLKRFPRCVKSNPRVFERSNCAPGLSTPACVLFDCFISQLSLQTYIPRSHKYRQIFFLFTFPGCRNGRLIYMRFFLSLKWRLFKCEIWLRYKAVLKALNSLMIFVLQVLRFNKNIFVFAWLEAEHEWELQTFSISPLN